MTNNIVSNSFVDRNSKHPTGEPQKVELNTVEMDEVFASAPLYRKSAIVTARLSKAGENLVTKLADGTVETSRTLEEDQYIVTNPGGEEYALTPEKFASRYEDMGDGNYRAIGKARIILNDTGSDVDIMAPWGELQHGKADCFFASGVDDDGNPTTDRYIIGRQECLDTYELLNI